MGAAVEGGGTADIKFYQYVDDAYGNVRQLMGEFNLQDTGTIEIDLRPKHGSSIAPEPVRELLRDGNGDAEARLFRSVYPNSDEFPFESNSGIAMGFRINSSDNNYLRYTPDYTRIRKWLEAPKKDGSDASGNWSITAANATNINTSQQNGSADRGVSFWSGIGSTGNQRLWSTNNNCKVNPGQNQFRANSFKAQSQTYGRSAQVEIALGAGEIDLPFGFYSPRYLVTEITDDTQGSFSAPVNFDVTLWDELTVGQRVGIPVITAQPLVGTSFEYLLGHEHVDSNGDAAERGVDYVSLIPPLVSTIKQLLNRVAALESNELTDDAVDVALLTQVSDLLTRVQALEDS